MYRIENTAVRKYAVTAFLFFSVLLSSYLSFAQHKSVLWGVTGFGGPQDHGYLFKYDVAGNQLTKMAWLNNQHTPVTYFTEFFATDSNYCYAIKSQNDSVDKSTIVRWNPKTNELKTLYTFDPDYYSQVSGSLTPAFGKYYGLAYSGKSAPYTYASGIIFEWDPVKNTVTNRYYFYTHAQGAAPRGQLLFLNNKFYGTTNYGGANDDGVLFEWNPVGNVLTDMASFSLSTTGRTPDSYLQFFNGKFYGICLVGGANSKGTLFEYDTTTHVLRNVYDFPAAPVWGRPVMNNNSLYISLQGTNQILDFDLQTLSPNLYSPFYSMKPASPMSYYNGTFYGVAEDISGGDSSYVYQWMPGSSPSANPIAKIHIDDAGKTVNGAPIFFNKKLYAITELGSTYGRGSIFEADTGTGKATVKQSFGSGIDGYSTYGNSSNLLLMENGLFYGTTVSGGHYNKGFLYSFNPQTQKVTRLHDFPADALEFPMGNLASTSTPHSTQFTGITVPALTQEYGGHNYWYDITADAFHPIGALLKYDPYYYDHGIPDAYLSYSVMIHAARAATNTEPGGLFKGYPGTAPTTREFTFPVPITPTQETGLSVFHDSLILGMGTLNINQATTCVIYQWAPQTNNFKYAEVPGFAALGISFRIIGIPVFFNNKLYVLVNNGSPYYNATGLAEWDQSTNTVALYNINNIYLDGHPFGSMTLADGKLYGYTDKGIFCFDPVTKSFGLVWNGTRIFSEFHLEETRQLTLALSNTAPQINAVAPINICLGDSLNRHIAFTATDADNDSLGFTVYYKDSTIIRSCSVTKDTTGGSTGKYYLNIAALAKEGQDSIIITATDDYSAKYSLPVLLRISSRPVVSFSFNIDTLCKKDTAIVLTGGAPAGGIYKVDNQPADSLRPGTLALGTHTVKYIYDNGKGCSDSTSHSFYIKDCPPATSPRAGQAVGAYPNPSSGKVNIENNDQLLTTVNVFNSQGYKVYTKQSADNIITLNLEQLQPGIYYITIINQKGTSNSRVEIIR